MNLDTPLSAITGIGTTYAQRLERLSLWTVEDLMNHFPFRYDDFSKSTSISQAKKGDIVTVSGEVWSIKNVYTRFGKVLTKAVVNDGSGTIEVTWFNQPWLTKNIKEGTRLQMSGKVDRFGAKVALTSPNWEKLSNELTTDKQNQSLHTGRLVPIYPETYGISSKWLRSKIDTLLPKIVEQIEETLPDPIKENMLDLKQALLQIHNPPDFQSVQKARDRLGFEELFFVQLATQLKRNEWKSRSLINPLKINQDDFDKFVAELPFQLTNAQRRVAQEIIQDLQKNQPMNRLVQGDVGSGKTVLAAIIIYLVYKNNLKSILMAPTEILAFQHHKTLSNLLNIYGIEVGIYTASKKIWGSKGESGEIESPYPVIVGTHALLSPKLSFDNVGLVVIDEQQRFGVQQRSLLRSKASSPHFLTMTATPIPRTVALTLYGDLDLSVIDELPQGRKNIQTFFVPKRKREDAYKFISNQIEKGFQIYIITPLIEESETETSAKAAKVEYENLSQGVFKKYRVGLLHGRLKSKEKEQVLNDFKDHKLDILVSTSVVEVGVDVPNATVMVIEGAERFGLAQLHQLRGRVGRGSEQSYTFLFAQEDAPFAVSRLKNLERISDGLKLAELDYALRGSGEIFSTKQSGEWDLKIASPTDLKMIEKARKAAIKIASESPNLDKYPQLKRKLTKFGADVMPD